MPINSDGSFSGAILKPRASIGSNGVASFPIKSPGSAPKPIRFELTPVAGKPAPNFINKDKDREAALAAQARQQQISEEQLATSQNQGGGSIICTRFYELGYMDVQSYALDEAFGVVIGVYEPELLTWYQRHAPKVVRLMHRDGWFVKWLWRHLGKPWSDHMKHQLNPCVPDNKRGEFLMNVGRFLCKL